MYLRKRGEGQTQIDKIEKRSLSCSLCDILRSSEGVRSTKKKIKKFKQKKLAIGNHCCERLQTTKRFL